MEKLSHTCPVNNWQRLELLVGHLHRRDPKNKISLIVNQLIPANLRHYQWNVDRWHSENVDQRSVAEVKCFEHWLVMEGSDCGVSRVNKHAIVILQQVLEVVDELVAFFQKVAVLLGSRLRAKSLSDSSHDRAERVIGSTEHPFSQLNC